MLGHWGEILLFWLDRADGLARVAGLEWSISDNVRTNIHITSSAMLNPALLRHVLAVTTIDRLMFSTDYPFRHPPKDEIVTFLDHFGSDYEQQKFSSANASALFGIAQ